MSENITGGILSVETESMTFFLFGVKIRYAGALSNPWIERGLFFLQYYAWETSIMPAEKQEYAALKLRTAFIKKVFLMKLSF